METINDLLKKRKTSITSLLTQSVAPISITQAAIDKANYISKRLCELMRERLEVSFFMTSDNVGEQGDLVISDMYIAHEQKVWPDYCEIKGNGNIRSFRDIADNQHRVIAGLGHSHAQMETSYSKRDIKTLSEIVKSWGVSKTLSLNNDIPGEVTPIIPLDAHEKIALKLKFPGEIPIILKSDLLDIFKYEKLLKFHWEISVPTEVTVQYLYGLTFNAHGSDPYCVIAYKLPDDDIGIVRDVGYKIVEHPYQVAVDPTQIDSELKERVLNLREKADEQKKLLLSSEDNAKEF